ncbi:unnamed protein product [Closterium sp. Naga37s-1]|nr:unnamed protein product [Closterium sp. Naga37s-1]
MASLASSALLPRAAVRPRCAAPFPASRLSAASALGGRKCLPPLPALSVKRRATSVRAAAAPAAPVATTAAMVKSGALTNLAQSVYSSVLPAGFAAGLGLTEVSVVLFLRESIVGLATLVVIYCAPQICRALNHVWATYVMADEEVTEEEFSDSMFGALVRPMQFALASAFLTRHLHMLVPALRQAAQAALMARARGVALVVAAAWFGIGWKDRILKLVADKRPEDKPVLANVSAVLTLLLRVLAGITIADMCGVSLKSLIAIGGISGFALAFASEKVVTNFFGGLVLVLTQPFAVREKIKVAGLKGKVQEIGFLHTTIEGDDLSPIIIPNSIFTSAVITNLTRAGCKTLEAAFVLRHEDVPRVKAITHALTAYLQQHPRVDRSKGPAMGYLKQLTGSGLQIGVVASIKDMSKGKFLPIQQEILEKSVEIILAEGALLGESAPYVPSASNGAAASSYAARKNLLWQRHRRSAALQ